MSYSSGHPSVGLVLCSSVTPHSERLVQSRLQNIGQDVANKQLVAFAPSCPDGYESFTSRRHATGRTLTLRAREIGIEEKRENVYL